MRFGPTARSSQALAPMEVIGIVLVRLFNDNLRIVTIVDPTNHNDCPQLWIRPRLRVEFNREFWETHMLPLSCSTDCYLRRPAEDLGIIVYNTWIRFEFLHEMFECALTGTNLRLMQSVKEITGECDGLPL